jgi:hypothetical protein
VSVIWDFSGGVVQSATLASPPTVNPTLVISNGVGAELTNALNHAYLSVDLPGIPTDVVAMDSGGQVQVIWNAGPQAGPEITTTTITATPLAPAGPPVQAVIDGPAKLAFIALAPMTMYSIVIVSSDAAGSGPPSAPIKFLTGGTAVTPPGPTNVSAWWTGQLPPGSSLGVHWTASVAGPNTIDQYEVLVVWHDGDNPGGTYDQTVGGQTLNAYFAVDNTSDWRIKVRAHDAAGWGTWSSPITIGGV